MSENLGTLEYELKIQEDKLNKQLDAITSQLKAKNAEWSGILSNIGTGSGIDPSKAVAANKAIAQSTDQIKGKITELRTELKKNLAAYEEMDAAGRKTKGGINDLATIQRQKDQIVELGKAYRQATTDKREAAKAEAYWSKVGKDELIAEMNLSKKVTAERISDIDNEIAAQKKFETQAKNAGTKLAFEEYERLQKESEKRIAQLNKEIAAEKRKTDAQELALAKIAAQAKYTPPNTVDAIDVSNKSLNQQLKVANDPDEIDRLSKAIAANNAARKQLIITEREQARQEKVLLQEQKLQSAINSQAEGSIGRLRAQLALYVFQLSQVTTKTPDATAKIKQLTQAISATKNQIDTMQPTLNMWGKLMSAIKTYAAAYISVQAVMGLGRTVFNQTKELDSLGFSMKTVIKSSTELAQTQKFLSDVAVNYGGDLLTLSERYIKFRAAAVQSNMSAGETQKIFESVSKAAGTLGLKTDELSGVYLALEQMISKGKVTTEELRRQLGERLPGAFGIMANALGVTLPQLDKMLKKGEVLSTDALPKFAAALEKAYGIESLSKIDTLAAAQGRMSTQFTELIRSMEASDTFKGSINAIASFLGFIKDNIGAITVFAKALLLVTTAIAAQRTVMAASVLIQKVWVILTGAQIVNMKQLTAAQLASAEATWVNVRSWQALSTTFKTFGGWVSILVNVLVTAAAAFFLFRGEAEKIADVMGDLNKEEDKFTRNLNYQKKVIKEAGTETERYKNAIKEINTVALKYNQALLTQADSQDKINASINETIKLVKEEYLAKRKVKLLEQAETDRAIPLDRFKETLYSMFDPNEAYDKYIQFEEMVAKGASNSDIIKAARGNKSIANDQIFIEAINAEREYLKKKADIEAKYKDKVTPNVIDIDIDELKKNINDAEDEFKRLEEVTKVGGKLAAPDVSLTFKTNKEYLKSLLVEYAKFPEALELINIELAKLEGKGVSTSVLNNRNEAIKKLNDKYLADQEEFANYDMGIAAGRIAAMEDGIEKEKKLNELAYENRLKAIEKEKIATLKTLNEANGTKIGSRGEILSFDSTSANAEVQKAIDRAKESDLQKRLNAEQVFREANLKSDKEYQYKVAEIRRDATDQFLSGLEKERAAIDEKYDDWVRKAGTNMKLIAELEGFRSTAKDELYKQYEIDQLDFVREIEYKKNEIRLAGSMNQRMLDKENFETYVNTELKRIKILKSSTSVDKQKEGLQKEELLDADKKIFKLKQEKELRDKILEGIKQATDELITQMGLSGADAENLKNAVDILSSVAKEDYLSAAINVFGMISESFDLFGKKRDEELQKHIDFVNETTEAQLKYNLALHDTIDLHKNQSIFFTDNANEILIASKKYANAQLEYNKILDNYVKIWDSRRGSHYNETKGVSLGTLLMDLKIPAEIGLTGLLATYPELMTKNADGTEVFNSSVAKAILTLKDLPIATTLALNGLVEWSDKMAEAQKGMEDAVSSMIGNLGSGIYTALSDAWDNGTDSFMAFKNTVSQGLEDIIKQMMFNAIWAASLEEFKQGIIDSYKVGGDNSIFDDIDKFFASAPENIKLTNNAMSELDRMAAASGMDWSGKSTSDTSSITKSIQGVTEDTARRLEGLINSIRETSVINIGNTKKLVESNQAIQAYASESLGHLRNIDQTTSDQLKLFNEIMTNANGTGGKGMKVYVQ